MGLNNDKVRSQTTLVGKCTLNLEKVEN